MTVEISYFNHFASGNRPMARYPASSESLAITASPVLSGVTPDGCEAILITSTEAFRYEYSFTAAAPGIPVTATATSHYRGAGSELWLTPVAKHKFSLRTA